MAKTDNEHFDRLWNKWIEITGNGARKKDALRFFTAKSRQLKQEHEIFANHLIAAIQRLERHYQEKRQKEGWAPTWMALAVFINKERYDDPIELESDKTTTQGALNYCKNHPGKPSHMNYPPFLCTECLKVQHEKHDPVTELRRQFWRENDLGNKTGDECRKMCLELIERKWG